MATTHRARLSHRRQKPTLSPVITRMNFPLAALHPLPQGLPHPRFPSSILSYHLLTEEECDSLAKYYHQWVNSPCIWTRGYPTTMDWDHEFFEHVGQTRGPQAKLDIKRRKIGRFIGLRGCDTPVEEVDERNKWYEKRDRMAVKSLGDVLGRRGWGSW